MVQQVTESDIVEIVENALKDSRASSATVAFALTALLKLSIRLPNSAEYVTHKFMPGSHCYDPTELEFCRFIMSVSL